MVSPARNRRICSSPHGRGHGPPQTRLIRSIVWWLPFWLLIVTFCLTAHHSNSSILSSSSCLLTASLSGNVTTSATKSGQMAEATTTQRLSLSRKGNAENNNQDPASLFSTPPWLSLPSPWNETVAKPKNRGCRPLLSSPKSALPKFQHSLARIVLYQKNGGRQLQTAVHHYLQAVPRDALIVIDNDSSSTTKQLLEQYAAMGIHVWQCSGDMSRKTVLWTEVINVYKHHSVFVFPVDVDELLMVVPTDKASQGTKEASALEWNAQTFYNALQQWKRIDNAGKAFKIKSAMAIPVDCPESPIAASKRSSSQLAPPIMRPPQSLVCELQWAEKQKELTCMNKCFARGREFDRVDRGNHHLKTTRFRIPAGMLPQKYLYQKCTQQLESVYQPVDNLVLLHLQSLDFGEWFLHDLRGAAAAQFTQPGMDCRTKKYSLDYCSAWQQMQQYHFDLDKLRDVYHQARCPQPSNDSNRTFYRVDKVFQHTCN